MKKLIAFILAVALVMSLVACSTVASAEAAEELEIRFRRVGECIVLDGAYYVDAGIFVDTYTGVLYLVSDGSHRSFMTVLVNVDGTPMIWEGWEND